MMFTPDSVLLYLAFAVAGLLVAALLSLLPGLHVYNIIGFAVLGYIPLAATGDPLVLVMFIVGLVSGYGILNTLSAVYLNAPDDSTFFYLLPSQKYLMQGRAHEAVILSGIGGLAGAGFLVAGVPLLLPLLVVLRDILSPYLFVVVGAIILFMLMSEWPKDMGTARTPRGKLRDAWGPLLAGLLTFLLAGLLGVILFNRNPVPAGSAFQGLMPAVVGLFAVPGILLNLISRVEIPPQNIAASVDVTVEQVARGSGGGVLGGMIGAFFPAITAGPAGLVAGHVTAQRDERVFIISQGTSKFIYYVGAVLLFFLPGLHKSKGVADIMIGVFFVPQRMDEFYLAMGAVALTGALGFLLLLGLSRFMARFVTRFRYRRISAGALIVIVSTVALLTGWQGLFVMTAASAIGLVPVMFQSRRLNLLAIILLPVFLNLTGYGPVLAAWLGVA